ncbi:MAG: HAMP domain-containing histidine kinase [Planctomycetes bacterium]|nr:HAMP domain-containing histidine kinase [Planctomycetota bacterium]
MSGIGPSDAGVSQAVLSALAHDLERQLSVLKDYCIVYIRSPEEQPVGRIDPGLAQLIDTNDCNSLYALLFPGDAATTLSATRSRHLLEHIAVQVDSIRITLENATGYLDRDSRAVRPRRSVDLARLLEEVCRALRPHATLRGVRLDFTPSFRALVNAVPSHIYRMFFNLIDNAIKYSYSGNDAVDRPRFVSVGSRWTSSEDGIVVRVSSYGIGIDQDEIATGAIYEYGYRGRRARGERSGMGLGLAEARRIASLNNATIEASSTPEPGGAFLTTFVVSLPTRRRGTDT